MINFQTLHKRIAKLGLIEKTIAQLSREDVLQLGTAFLTAALESKKSCGTCWYQGWNGVKPTCQHPDHPAAITAWQDGLGCPDWSEWDDKELGPHRLNRRAKATV